MRRIKYIFYLFAICCIIILIYTKISTLPAPLKYTEKIIILENDG